jgi:hypothetical protein
LMTEHHPLPSSTCPPISSGMSLARNSAPAISSMTARSRSFSLRRQFLVGSGPSEYAQQPHSIMFGSRPLPRCHKRRPSTGWADFSTRISALMGRPEPPKCNSSCDEGRSGVGLKNRPILQCNQWGRLVNPPALIVCTGVHTRPYLQFPQCSSFHTSPRPPRVIRPLSTAKSGVALEGAKSCSAIWQRKSHDG